MSACLSQCRGVSRSRTGPQYLIQSVLGPPRLLLRLLQLLPQGAHLAARHGAARGLIHYWQVPIIPFECSVNRRQTTVRQGQLVVSSTQRRKLEMV